MSTKILKPVLATIAASLFALGSATIAHAKPNLCKPAVTTTAGCTACHNGKPSVASYIQGACQKASGGGRAKPPINNPGVGQKPPVRGGMPTRPPTTQQPKNNGSRNKGDNDDDDDD